MKLIILSSTILEFTGLVIDGFMEGTSPNGLKNGLASIYQKGS